MAGRWVTVKGRAVYIEDGPKGKRKVAVSERTIPEQHQARVEAQTRRMPPAMRGVMGGGTEHGPRRGSDTRNRTVTAVSPTDARKKIKRIYGSQVEVVSVENSTVPGEAERHYIVTYRET